ncbi:hypothetical protein BB559_001818 [Furculomyces boomerangus]|uniref:Pre-mRNA-processing protein 45 n=2 Tax=Harpellales TaxID=61421 RepID=A0A2T9Z045_9FUNG|nr:hypothetical protein BB559_001818 [Furculomyces boomerangus]PWA03789.1 hypothetical protein BB558_000072 [Smittium angustum]
MSTLSSLLPEPRFNSRAGDETVAEEEFAIQQSNSKEIVSKKRTIPPYGKRQGWTPKTLEDFGDGGAYPEILIGQYPLRMGIKSTKKGKVLSKQVDSEGNIKYDAIAKYGHGENRIVQSEFKEIVPLRERLGVNDDNVMQERPDEDTIMETAERTRQAIEKKIQGKLASAKPLGGRNQMEPGISYIRYTPNESAPDANSGISQRIIRMSEMPVDPMEPPKFKHKRIPGAPPSPPAPVLHSPPRPVSVEEQKAWVIPPCISNWKNAKGYTIPLDKRLAADGRGLQEVKINDNFAKLSEAMLAAERHAREEVRQRALMQQNLARKEKENKEEHLRMLAQRAREERSGVNAGIPSRNRNNEELDYKNSREKGYSSNSETEVEESSRGRVPPHNREDDDEVRKREEIRREKQKELRRDLRMSKMGTEAKAKYMAKVENRDISEKIALGLAKPKNIAGDAMFDSRLIHRNESSGPNLNDDESYSIYDKPLLHGSNANANYRPRNIDTGEEDAAFAETINKSLEVDRFGNGMGSKVKDNRKQKSGNVRANPVEFEKEDIFGVNQFLNEAKLGLKRGKDGDDRSPKKHKG